MDLTAWINSLDPPTRSLVLGAASEFVGGVAADIATALFARAGHGVQKKFKPTPESQALTRAVAYAVVQTARRAGQTEEEVKHVVERLGAWAVLGDFAGELSSLLSTNPEETPDMGAMRKAVEESGGDPDTLSSTMTFEVIIATFVSEFGDGATREDLLVPLIQTKHLAGIDAGVQKVIGILDPDTTGARLGYLQHLVEETRCLPMQGLDPAASDATWKYKGTCLTDVYIDLDSTGSRGDPDQADLFRKQEKALPLLEVFADHPALIVLGDPGSGKSTFANHLVHCVAAFRCGDTAAKERVGALPDEWLGKTPVRIILRDMAAWARSAAGNRKGAALLKAYVRYYIETSNCDSFVTPCLQDIEKGNAFVVLDGWDEVTDPEVLPRLRTMLKLAPKHLTGCPILLTCRVRSFDEDAWRIEDEGWHTTNVRLLDDEKIGRFVGLWYDHLGARTKRTDLSGQAEKLRIAVRRPDLQRMARNPLLLTMMAIDHADKGELPDARSVVYDDIVELLLWKWREVDKENDDDKTPRPPSLRDVLRGAGRQDIDFKVALWELAYNAHKGQDQTGKSDATADIAKHTLLERFAALSSSGEDYNWANEILKMIQLRAGLLIPARSDSFTFPHRTFQEYLAARHLCSRRNKADALAEHARDPRWREVVLLAVNWLVHHEGDLSSALGCVQGLSWTAMTDDEPFEHWPDVAMAGDCLVEIGPRNPKEPDNPAASRIQRPDDVALLNANRHRLALLMADERIGVAERVRIGTILGMIGDPRNLDEMIRIPAGPFQMGDDGDEDRRDRPRKTTGAYRIGKYPVTVAQYRRFCEATGCVMPPAPGWGWIENHPIVNVTWHDARDFCECAGGRLPTEKEWEKAARWDHKVQRSRVYPWGDEWDPDSCRCSKKTLGDAGSTAPVGSFPSGESPYGCHDMAGNVWEWCDDPLDERGNPIPASDVDDKKTSVSIRALRGGSWVNDRADLFRAADRLRGPPDYWSGIIGFRIVLPEDVR